MSSGLQFCRQVCALQPSTVLHVFDGVMLWQSGARRQGGTGGVRTVVGENGVDHDE